MSGFGSPFREIPYSIMNLVSWSVPHSLSKIQGILLRISKMSGMLSTSVVTAKLPCVPGEHRSQLCPGNRDRLWPSLRDWRFLRGGRADSGLRNRRASPGPRGAKGPGLPVPASNQQLSMQGPTPERALQWQKQNNSNFPERHFGTNPSENILPCWDHTYSQFLPLSEAVLKVFVHQYLYEVWSKLQCCSRGSPKGQANLERRHGMS